MVAAVKGMSNSFLEVPGSPRSRPLSPRAILLRAMPHRAVYAGSFDPFHLGHEDIVRRGLDLFDEVLVAVGTNPRKAYLFTGEERLAMARDALSGLSRVQVEPFSGLVTDHARLRGATVLLRGLRLPSDFEFEHQMAVANRRLAPSIETVLLLAGPEYAFLSSTLIREIATYRGDVSRYVAPCVGLRLKEKFPSP